MKFIKNLFCSDYFSLNTDYTAASDALRQAYWDKMEERADKLSADKEEILVQIEAQRVKIVNIDYELDAINAELDEYNITLGE